MSTAQEYRPRSKWTSRNFSKAVTLLPFCTRSFFIYAIVLNVGLDICWKHVIFMPIPSFMQLWSYRKHFLWQKQQTRPLCWMFVLPVGLPSQSSFIYLTCCGEILAKTSTLMLPGKHSKAELNWWGSWVKSDHATHSLGLPRCNGKPNHSANNRRIGVDSCPWW